MNIYKLLQLETGDVELSHSSCCYPVKFEEKINQLAGEKITIKGPYISFLPGFIHTFSIKKDKLDLFLQKVIPNIGFKYENGYNIVWDKEENII